MDKPQLGPRYLALYPLAAGGMAEVWVGAQKVAAVQRPVAIKRILPQFADDPKYVSMFLDEAHLAACIDSPNVVSIIDADVAEDGAPFLVMELIEGLSLAAMLKSKAERMDVGMICYVIQQAADGLHDAHEARAPSGELLELVHRDVSPQNLLVGIDGRVRLADFGVARALERMTQTLAGEFKGKLNYCAPEQLHGVVDRRSDIFSLGVVIRQALSGQGLFGRSSSSAEAVRKLLDKEIQPTGELLPDIDQELAAVVDKAIVRDPALRYSTAAEFAEALASFADASRVTLGKMVETLGGADLKAQRDKTTDIFARLRNEVTSSFVEVGPKVAAKVEAEAEDEAEAEAEVVVEAEAEVEVEVEIKAGAEVVASIDADVDAPIDSSDLDFLRDALPKRRRFSWMWGAIVVALAIGAGTLAGLVGGEGSEEIPAEPREPEDLAQVVPRVAPEPVRTGDDDGIPVADPSPPNVVVDEPATEPTPQRRHRPHREPVNRDDDLTSARQTTTETPPNVANDPLEVPEPGSTSTPPPTDMDESTTMNRRDRLDRDVF